VEYFPFGETWVEEHSNRQRTPYLFTGKELDEDTGLYYYGARYYDPLTSVWQSPDPILVDYLKGERSGEGVYRRRRIGHQTL
jgi:RHS repeat-associated protein